MPNIGGVAAGAVRKVTDTFTRTTSGSLGTPSGGNQRAWSTASGTWYANGSSAQSDDPASYYSNTFQLLYPEATMSADVSGGVGLAFWGSSANASAWHSSYPNYVQNSSTSSSCTGSTVSCSDTANTCAPGGCGTVSSSSVTTCTGPDTTCSDFTNTCTTGCGSLTSSSTTQYCAGGVYLPAGHPYATSGAGCYTSSTGTYIAPAQTQYIRHFNTNVTTYTRTQNTTVSSTTYTYDTRITTILTVVGSIMTTSTSTLVSGAGSLSTVGSLKVVTANNSATITAYSSPGLSSQLGSPITYSPGSTQTAPYVGIVKAPSSYNQGSTLDNYSANA